MVLRLFHPWEREEEGVVEIVLEIHLNYWREGLGWDEVRGILGSERGE